MRAPLPVTAPLPCHPGFQPHLVTPPLPRKVSREANVTVVVVELAQDDPYPLPETAQQLYAQQQQQQQYEPQQRRRLAGAESTFVRAPLLERSVLSTPHLALSLNASSPRRPLPLLSDVLKALYEASAPLADQLGATIPGGTTGNAEGEGEGDIYLAFSNADIGMMPDFYGEALRYIKRGHSAAPGRRPGEGSQGRGGGGGGGSGGGGGGRKRGAQFDSVAINRVEIPEAIHGE